MTLSENLRNQRKRVLLVKLGGDETLVDLYLERADRRTAQNLLVDPKLIDAILREKAAARSGPSGGPRTPLFEVSLICPGHEPVGTFKGWFSLGHQQVEENLFGVPRTLGGMDGYARVDYVLLESQVCPGCFYASPLRQDFGRPGMKDRGRVPEVLRALAGAEARDERAQLAGKPPPDFRDPERSPETARLSYLLAVASARQARAAGEKAAAYKEAHAHLRLARLAEDAGDPSGHRACLQAALQAYTDYRTVELPDELLGRVTRQIVALAVALGDDHAAAQHRSALFEARTRTQRRLEEQEMALRTAQRGRKDAPERMQAAFQEAEKCAQVYVKYFNQADQIWQDREQHRLPGGA